MIKLVSTIIDEKCNLRGFVCRAKAKEFGSTGNNEVYNALTVEQLAKFEFKNNQIEVKKNGVIYELGYFKIHDLPMKRLGGNGLEDVPNTIEIKNIVKMNGEVGGYDVVILNRDMRLDTNSVIRVSRYFKPVNFQVRVKQDCGYFIAGSNGMKMADFPVVDLGAPTNIGKNQIAGSKPKKAVVNKEGVVIKEPQMKKVGCQVGLMDLYTAIQVNGGSISLLPNSQYVKTTNSEEYSSEFTSLGIGEVARLAGNGFVLNKTQLNASATFKKPGIVRVADQDIECYTLNTKKLINNGENHIKSIGIAIPHTPGFEAVLNLIGDPARCELVEDRDAINKLREVSGVDTMVMFTCDISDVPVVLEKDWDKYILNTDELYNEVVNLTGFEIANKYIRQGTGLCNELKKAIGSAKAAQISGRNIYHKYSGMKPELIKAIAEAGIDVFSGAYTKVGKKEYSSSDGASKTETARPNVEIKYYLAGFDADKWPYAKIKAEYESGTTCQLPGRNLVDKVINFTGTDEERYAEALKLAESIERYVEALRKKLWLHKYCMYMKYDGKIHNHDKELWLSTVTKKKTAKVYECEKHSGFMIEVAGTDL